MGERVSHASESVAAGHPDKVCDQVAAAILDAAINASAAALARYEYKKMAHEGFADQVEIEVCYGIGRPRPFILNIDTFGTAKVPEKLIQERAGRLKKVSVDEILEILDLFNPAKVSYQRAAVGGWFGRQEFPWEQV